jgi:hypothetical protein
VVEIAVLLNVTFSGMFCEPLNRIGLLSVPTLGDPDEPE